MSNYLLDTDIISSILKNNKNTFLKITDALKRGEQVFINGITYYEIKRGLLAINGTSKLLKFNRFCESFDMLWLGNQSIFDEAASIYSELKIRGELIKDSDILIAALAKVYKLVVITNNIKHFERIRDIEIMNWL